MKDEAMKQTENRILRPPEAYEKQQQKTGKNGRCL
jgi:hypothetical protein